MSRAIALLVLAFPACQGSGDPTEDPDPRQITSLTGEVAPVVHGNNQFTWDAYQLVHGEPGNLFFSPFSITAAFSMVYGGAEGETAAQLEDAFGIADPDAWHTGMGALLADLGGEHHRPYTLCTANRLWGAEGYPFEDDYLDLTDTVYGAPLVEADFAGDPEGVRSEINDWVAKQTRDRIRDLFARGQITTDTRLVLANAIFFLADWASPFDPEATSAREFDLGDGGSVEVPMMSQTGTFLYAEDDLVQVLEATYESDDVSMVFLLPREGLSLADLVGSLDVDRVDAWVASVDEFEELPVVLPSFELNWEMPILDTLLGLGVADLFDPGVADLSGIADTGLFISAVVHKAFVRVDEKGTEAAAATGVVGDDTGSSLAFVADRPFLFFIRDRLTGTILFVGRMEDPSLAPLGR